MDNTFVTVLTLFLYGFKDSIWHLFNVFSLDRHVAQHIDKRTEKKERLLLATPKTLRRQARLWLNRHKVLKCIMWCTSLSIVIYTSIFFFYSLVLPLLQSAAVATTQTTVNLFPKSLTENFQVLWNRVEIVLSVTFNLLWLLPLFVVSKIVCSLWFGEVAENCYFITYGKPATPTRISTFIADLLFSVVVQLIFLVQCGIVALIPLNGVNVVFEVVHCALLHSWYAFEYKWLNFGWDINSRLKQLHTYWPYYVGFGLPMHLVTTQLVHILSDHKHNILNGCIFSTAFPMLIISAIASSRELNVDNHSTIVIKIFEPSVTVANWLMVKIQTIRRKKPKKQKASSQ